MGLSLENRYDLLCSELFLIIFLSFLYFSIVLIPCLSYCEILQSERTCLAWLPLLSPIDRGTLITIWNTLKDIYMKLRLYSNPRGKSQESWKSQREIRNLVRLKAKNPLKKKRNLVRLMLKRFATRSNRHD